MLSIHETSIFFESYEVDLVLHRYNNITQYKYLSTMMMISMLNKDEDKNSFLCLVQNLL